MNWRRARLAAECGVSGIGMSPERVEYSPGIFTWYWWSFGSTFSGMTDPCGCDDARYGGQVSRSMSCYPDHYPGMRSHRVVTFCRILVEMKGLLPIDFAIGPHLTRSVGSTFAEELDAHG
jgi:hypothetical protein